MVCRPERFPSNVSAVLISFNTDVFSTCRYATSSGVSYDAMTNEVSHTSLGIFHTATISGITRRTSRTIFMSDALTSPEIKILSDYLISFTAGQPTGTGRGGGTGGGSDGFSRRRRRGIHRRSVSAGSIGSPALVLRGVAAPNISISVLQDGKSIVSRERRPTAAEISP
jgi:hypothetical protein